MSILLDAVTRSKQQTPQVQHDPVLTPRAQYQDKPPSRLNYKKIAVTVLLVTVVILIAWLASQYAGLASLSSRPQNLDVQQRQPSPAIENQPVQSEPLAPVSSVRIAGKVALPLSRELPQAPAAQRQSTPASVEQQQSPQPRPKTATAAAVSHTPGVEPIILGANANQRGQQLLASLRSQVEAAATDVGLHREPATDNADKLMAAFEVALKEVERNKSVATPVTPAKLDPIPTPKQDDIPRYGQLPAGLQLQVPEFNINAHVYASSAENRWLNVDGAELQQGDLIQGKLTVVEIRPRDIILSIEGTEFKVPAI